MARAHSHSARVCEGSRWPAAAQSAANLLSCHQNPSFQTSGTGQTTFPRRKCTVLSHLSVAFSSLSAVTPWHFIACHFWPGFLSSALDAVAVHTWIEVTLGSPPQNDSNVNRWIVSLSWVSCFSVPYLAWRRCCLTTIGNISKTRFMVAGFSVHTCVCFHAWHEHYTIYIFGNRCACVTGYVCYRDCVLEAANQSKCTFFSPCIVLKEQLWSEGV